MAKPAAETDLSVAVVIPAYRNAATVSNAVASVLGQTLPATEVVVVDDGSPEDIRSAIAGLPVRYVRRENAGPAAARNTGIEETSAPLVAFLDADDLWHPRKLEVQVAVFRELPDTVACCTDGIITWEAREIDWNEAAPHLINRRVPDVLTVAELLRRNVVGTLTVIARRAVIEAVGGFDEEPTLIAVEDYDLWLKLAERGPFRCVKEPLACCRRSGQSLSDARRFLSGVERVFQKFLDRHPDRRDYLGTIKRRRGELHRDVAYDSLVTGEFALALRAALKSLRYDSSSFAAYKMIASTLLRRRPP